MTKADQISHLCQMIRGNIYHAHDSNLNEDFGYITRLQAVAAAGGFATEGTLEIMELNRAMQELDELAISIRTIRNRLVNNSKARAVA